MKTRWITAETSKDLPFKLIRALSFTLRNHEHKMMGEYKGHSFSLNTKLALKVPQDVTEVDVEKLQRRQIADWEF